MRGGAMDKEMRSAGEWNNLDAAYRQLRCDEHEAAVTAISVAERAIEELDELEEELDELKEELDALKAERDALLAGYLRMRDEVAAAIRKPPLEGSIGQAFDALRDAAGGAWDGVDVEEYLGGVRGGEGQGE